MYHNGGYSNDGAYGPIPGTPTTARSVPLDYSEPYSNDAYRAPYGAQRAGPGETAEELWGSAPAHRAYSKPENTGGSGSKKKWWIIGGVVLLVLIGAGVGAGVGIAQSNKNKTGSTAGGSSSSGDDPSSFAKDPNLKKVFWGLAYSPKDSIFPNCWANLTNVITDIQLMSQMTDKIRLYGGNCNTTELVLAAIKETKVSMSVYPAIYLDSGNLTAQYEVQVEALRTAFEKYGVDNVAGIAVGNEYILNLMAAAGAETAPKGTAYTSAVTSLTGFIQDFNTTLLSWDLGKHIPVGTGDAGALMSTTLGKNIDYYMANVHPWFAGTTVEDSAAWTYEYYMETDVAPAEASPNTPETFVAETGWPTAWTKVVDPSVDQRAGTDATVENLQIFLDTYVCQANANGTKYFYFEPFDEPWKEAQFGGVEGFWGLFNSDRTLKAITLPDCVIE